MQFEYSDGFMAPLSKVQFDNEPKNKFEEIELDPTKSIRYLSMLQITNWDDMRVYAGGIRFYDYENEEPWLEN